MEPPLSKDAKKLRAAIDFYVKEWTKRKAICLDFCSAMAESMDKKTKEVIKIMEVETDEDAGVKKPERPPQATALGFKKGA